MKKKNVLRMNNNNNHNIGKQDMDLNTFFEYFQKI